MAFECVLALNQIIWLATKQIAKILFLLALPSVMSILYNIIVHLKVSKTDANNQYQPI